jgi:hypothetical protein
MRDGVANEEAELNESHAANQVSCHAADGCRNVSQF